MNKQKPKILVLDIETCPLESWTWGIWEQNVGLEQIKTEWSILSYAAQWVGSKEVIYEDTSGFGPDYIRNDAPLVLALRKLLDQADIVIAQNGKRFDVRKINARMIMLGIRPPSPYRVVDTMIEAKKYFAFTSNKLEWLSKWLTGTPKLKHKQFPGFELWAECLKDNPKAWAVMKKYNIRDIKATLLVYRKLLPWMNNHPNMGMYNDSGRPICPNCGSARVTRSGLRTTQNATYYRYNCQSCGAWPRGKIMQTPLALRRTKLVGSGN